MPTLSRLIAGRRRWTVLPVVLYGRAVSPRIFPLDALWYGALRAQLGSMQAAYPRRGVLRNPCSFSCLFVASGDALSAVGGDGIARASAALLQ